ncbi:MAG: hypothetical protein LBN20_02860 [Endomicrobium sp.]|nr:hypothetical protein [Endomicrobium sp.]
MSWRDWYRKNKTYQKLKILNDSIKDFLKCFYPAIKVFFSNSNEDIIYIAFLGEGGIGDYLMQRSILTELVKMNPNICIDIYNQGTQALNKDIKDKTRFYLVKDAAHITKKQYDIAYIVSHDAFEIFVKRNKKFTQRIVENLEQYKYKYPECFALSDCVMQLDDNILNFKMSFKSHINFHKLHTMSVFKIRAGVDNIENCSPFLKYDTPPSPSQKFLIMDTTKYLTFQCGAGGEGFVDNGVKCWSIDNWEKTAAILRDKLSADIKFVQIGTGKEYLKGMDIIANGKTSLNELCYLLDNSILNIGIEGGCVHIAKALGRKSLVLWGVTVAIYNRLAYPENINIIPQMCSNIKNDGEINHIKPEFVAQKIAEYLGLPK